MLIRGLKERGQLAQANMFARFLARTINAHPQSLPRLNALVPIPSSAASLRKRGFNPAAEIARALRPALRVPLQQSWLRRTRESDLQKTLDFEARRKSVQGLYVCDQVVPPIWIGVVDDVLTSGSTMHEASLALKRAGARGVVALVAARATW
jgi:predicted amidophosphoribosyltransferase